MSGDKKTVEHILPQSIENQPYWKERFDIETHEKYRHDIGNLALTRDNSFLGNKSFPHKKGKKFSGERCYANSLLLQENELTKWDEWTVNSIDERRRNLLTWAKGRWHVDSSGKDEDTYEEEPDYEESEDQNLSLD